MNRRELGFCKKSGMAKVEYIFKGTLVEMSP